MNRLYCIIVVMLLWGCRHEPMVTSDKNNVTLPLPLVKQIDTSRLIRQTPGKEGFASPKTAQLLPATNVTYLAGQKISVKLQETKIHLDQLPLIVPGENNVPLPKTYLLPDTGFAVFDNDTIWAAVPKNALHPKPLQTLPMRMADNADCNMQYLEVEQGLPSPYIVTMLQDKRGNFWLCSDGGGANYYNGKTLLVFTENEGLCSNIIWTAMEDHKGNVWFGSSGGGVSCYNGQTFTTYTERNGMAHNRVRHIFQDSKKNIWFGSFGGLVQYDGKSFTVFTTDNGLAHNRVMYIFEDNAGNLWVATDGGGISCYNGKGFRNFTTKQGLPNNNTLYITQDKNNHIWVGTEQGVCYIDSNRTVSLNEHELIRKNPTRCVFPDPKGNIWIGTDGAGAFCFDGKTLQQFSTKRGLSGSRVWSILADHNQNLWFGTYEGGITRYNPNSFVFFNTDNGLVDNTVINIMENTDSTIWIGTKRGISIFDGYSFANYTTEQGLWHNYNRLVVRASNGTIWLGTHGGGISSLVNNNLTNYTQKQGLCFDRISCLIEDRQHRIWASSYGNGISCFDGKTFTNYTTADGLPNNVVRSLTLDKQGNLWIGSFGSGVTRYDGKTFTTFTTQNGLINNMVFTLMTDHVGNVWMGTENGVSRYNGEYFDNFGTDDGLVYHRVFALIEDSLHNVWVATEGGLNFLELVSKKTINQNLVFNQYKNHTINRADGLKSADITPHAARIDSKNRLWLGSGKMLTMLELDKFTLPNDTPSVWLESIDIGGEYVDFRALQKNEHQQTIDNIAFSSVTPYFNIPEKLQLPYQYDHLTFHFSATYWSAPHSIQYQYKLIGQEEEWNRLTTDNKAEYRNLSHGEYTFVLRAVGSSGNWSSIYEYNFTILPPWWLTWWAIMLWFVLFFGSGIGFYWVRISGLKKRQRELEKKVTERTQQLRETNEELHQTNEELAATLETVNEQKNEIEKSHKSITASINYASRIQNALLPDIEQVSMLLSQHFIIFKPRDVVSGDFYWIKTVNQHLIIAVADCTGHGVPGAFMSLLGISFLNEIVQDKQITRTSEALEELRNTVKKSLKQQGYYNEPHDGMDIALCAINTETLQMSFSGAYHACWIFRNDKLENSAELENSDKLKTNNTQLITHNSQLLILDADRQPIGIHVKEKPFTEHVIQLTQNDTLYLFSDGYVSQFNPRKEIFGSKRLKETLLNLQHHNMVEQKHLLEQQFNEWRGNTQQTDDVLLVGIRISDVV